jgi:hypothetical protein
MKDYQYLITQRGLLFGLHHYIGHMVYAVPARWGYYEPYDKCSYDSYMVESRVSEALLRMAKA